MKLITIIGLTLLGCLPFTAQASEYAMPSCNLSDILHDPSITFIFHGADHLSAVMAKADEFERQHALIATIRPFENSVGFIKELTPDIKFAYRGPIERLRKFIAKKLTEVGEKIGPVGLTSMAFFSGFIAFPYIASYVWGKIGKPVEDSSSRHKRAYYSAAVAIPFLVPLLVVLREGMPDGNGGVFAALCFANLISSYFGHKHA